MTPEEILSQFLKKDQRILHIGGDPILEKLTEAFRYTRHDIENFEVGDLSSEHPYDYVVLSDALELVDNPIELIKQIKNHAKSTIIYEFKYEEMEDIDPAWKRPWQNVGLEYTVTKEFDFVNTIFLGYATLYTCEMPYNLSETDKEHPNAIR
jgi:hypothetical protein